MRKNEIFRSYGTDFTESTKRLLTAADLISDIRGKVPASGFRIGIKPNLVCPCPAEFGGTTHPEIIAGLIEYLLRNGITAEQLLILEGSWVGDKTEEAFEYCGYNALSRKYGVRLLDLQKETEIITKDCAGMELHICRAALDVDFLINVPVLKGHCQTKITCALKNMKGLIPNSEKRRFHRLGLHRPIAHLNTALRPDFILIDHICGDPDFEEGGNPLVRNCIMAAKDPVLTDAYTCRILGCRTEEVPYIGIAETLGIGSADLSSAVVRTVSGTPSDGEPSDHDDLSAPLSPAALPETRRLVSVSCAVDAVDSCSACFGVLIPALDRLKEEGLLEALMARLNGERIAIGQGCRGRSGILGIGACTSGFSISVKGCPPKEEEVYAALESFARGE